jgi:trehalose 6-phosphate phosphatase
MMPLPLMADPAAFAWFLDFDGTLVEIADRPDAVRLEDCTRATVERLCALCGGAVAIVTGREIAVIDAFLHPLRLPVAGVHGLTRRDSGGTVHDHAGDASFLAIAEGLLAPLVREAPALLVERKSGAIALHYRARPDLEPACLDVMERLAGLCPSVRLVRGKMVIEARPDGADKGSAVAAFLAEPPFLGRRPVFVGDDVTDEDAFAEVNARGGLSVKIGPGETVAQWRIEDSRAFLDWMAEIVSPRRPESAAAHSATACNGAAS